MSALVKSIAVAFIAFLVLDGLWLGLLMADFYREQLRPIARMSDGTLAPNWAAAFFVYVALAVGIGVFVVSRSPGVVDAAALGALFGAVVYGVYDLTNYSTLASFPLMVALVDMMWGGVACAAASLVSRWALG